MDSVLNDINGFGRYQKIVLLIIGATSSLNAMAIFATVFIAAEPDLLCRFSNSTIDNSQKCDIWKNITKSKELNISSPYNCEWDTKYYGLTIINEWELICDRAYLAGLTQTIFMVGSLSSFFMGYFSDKYGRKFVCLIMAIIMCLTFTLNEIFQIKALGLSVDVRYGIYFVSQFSIGFTSYVLYVTSYLLLIEIIASKYNTIASNTNLYLYVFGELIALAVAYLFKDWHLIDWFLVAYSFAIVLLIFFVLPESPRYLLALNKHKEAYAILTKIAKINGTLDKLKNETDFITDLKAGLTNKSDDNEKLLKNSNQKLIKSNSPLHFLMNPKFNLIISIIMAYVWIALSLVYFGVSLGITSISSNLDPYLMYLLSSVAEIVGYIACHLNDRFSRKRMMIFFLGSAGIMCLIVALIPKETSSSSSSYLNANSILVIIFASIGKAMASAAFNSGYVFTSKLYPTSVRNTLVSLVLSVGRIGSLISPQINLLKTLVWAPLPYFIFSFSSLIASFVMIFVPNPSKTD